MSEEKDPLEVAYNPMMCHRPNLVFRAWNALSKSMYSPEEMAEKQMRLAVDGRGFVDEIPGEPDLTREFPRLIPLQWTGLDDNKGQRIFVGDIIRIACKYYGTYLGLVILRNGAFTISKFDAKQESNGDSWKMPHDQVKSRGFLIHWGGDTDDNYSTPIKIHHHNIEVVGNYYQNPELIQK